MDRISYFEKINESFEVNRIVVLLGPRQCGKTTIAKQYSGNIVGFSRANYFDLENETDLLRLESPQLTFEQLEGLIIIDEVQRRPDLFQILRYIHDENLNKRFLILGSASRDLIKQSSESLAGRISYIEITPFSLMEMPQELDKLWLRGGFPRSFLANNERVSYLWRQDYIKTYIEQDLPALGVGVAPNNIRVFWAMLAHYHGHIFNSSELANSMQLSANTIKSYLALMSATFMVMTLLPWSANIKKRQVKSPKIYFRDSGVYHYFLRLEDKAALLTSPKIGASWEGFALEQIVRLFQADEYERYFWATHNQAELDLLIVQNGKKYGFEFKYQDAPNMTRSMHMALQDLELDKLTVIYPGHVSYPLHEKVRVVGLMEYLQQVRN